MDFPDEQHGGQAAGEMHACPRIKRSSFRVSDRARFGSGPCAAGIDLEPVTTHRTHARGCFQVRWTPFLSSITSELKNLCVA